MIAARTNALDGSPRENLVANAEDSPRCFCGGGTRLYVQNEKPVRGEWRDSCSHLYACDGCGYLVFHPLPSEELLSSYYKSAYWADNSSRVDAEIAYKGGNYYEQAASISKLLSTFGDGRRVHEIGCGYGATVHHLNALGLDASGSDLSVEAAEIAKSLGNSRVSVASLEEYLSAGERHDAFFMSHSLEHHVDPRAPVRAAVENLKDGGLLIVRVPNGLHAPSRSGSFYEFTWLQYPDHLHYFTPVSLAELLESEGLEVVSLGCLPREDRPDSVIGALLGLRASDLPEPAAFYDALYRNGLGMELQAVGRKSGRRSDAAACYRALERARPSRNSYAAPTNVASPSDWRYTVGGAPMTLSDDGRTWHTPTAWVTRDHMLIRGELTAHTTLSGGPTRIRIDCTLPCAARLTIKVGDRVIHASRETSARVFLERFVQGEAGEQVSVRLDVDEHPWPAVTFHAEATALRFE